MRRTVEATILTTLQDLKTDNAVIHESLNGLKRDSETNRHIMSVCISLVAIFLPILITFELNSLDNKIQDLHTSTEMKGI